MRTEVNAYVRACASRLLGDTDLLVRRRTVEELASLSEEIAYEAESGEPITLRVELLSHLTPLPAEVVLREPIPHSLWETYEFRLSATVDVDADGIVARNAGGGLLREEVAFHLATAELEKVVGDLVLISNIAKPGGLEFRRVAITAENRWMFPSPLGNDLGLAVKRASDLGWPPLTELAISEVWTWAHSVSGFKEGVGRGRVGRALGALSHLMRGGERSPADLAWALLGLEALYGKGTQGLKAQIIEKSGTLLGRATEHKKRFDGIYDYRSRFVHGDLDIPFAYTPYDALPDVETFRGETSEGEYLATAMLLATLQHLAAKRWIDIDFAYNPIGRSEPPVQA
jgi:hypothetical protein